MYQTKLYDGYDSKEQVILWKHGNIVDENSTEALLNQEEVVRITNLFSELKNLKTILESSINENFLKKFVYSNWNYPADTSFTPRMEITQGLLPLTELELYSIHVRYQYLLDQVDQLNEGLQRVRKE